MIRHEPQVRRLPPCLPLLTPVVNTGQALPAAGVPGNFAAADTAASESAAHVPPAGAPVPLEGTDGFRSPYDLLNRDAWPTLTLDGAPPRLGPAAVDLADLRKELLRSAVVFVPH